MFKRRAKQSLQFISMSQGERERERRAIERFTGVEYEAIRRQKFPRGGAQTVLEQKALVREKQERKLARLRNQNLDIVDAGGWMAFWAIKALIIVAMSAGIGVLVTMDGINDKVLIVSGLIGLMGVGFLFKDGFNLRQWRKGEYSGLNLVWRWTGMALVYGSLACMIVWSMFATVGNGPTV